MLKESRISMDGSEQMSHITSPRASSRFNQVVETKRFKGFFFSEAVKNLKYPCLTKIGWYVHNFATCE